MAMICKTCGKDMNTHIIPIEERQKLLKELRDKNTTIERKLEIQNEELKVRTCPLERYATAVTNLNEEIMGLYSMKLPQGNKTIPGLEYLDKNIPKETPLLDYIDFSSANTSVYTPSLLIESSTKTFLLHFIRLMIEIDRRGINFVDANQKANKNQFNYLWLTPDLLQKYLYKHTFNQEDRWQSANDFKLPIIQIYPIGLQEIQQKEWGDAVNTQLMARLTVGMPVWVLQTKHLFNTQEYKTSERIQKTISTFKKVTLEAISDKQETFKTQSQSQSQNQQQTTITTTQGTKTKTNMGTYINM